MVSKETRANAHAVWEVKKKLLTALSGVPKEVSAIALADAVALQIANRRHATDPALTNNLRQHFLEQHIDQVLRLIPVNEEILIKAKDMKEH